MTELAIQVQADEAADSARLDELTRALADDLRAIGGLAVRPPYAPPDPATKGSADSIGYLIVSGLLSASTLGAIRDVIVAYLARARARAIHVRVGDNEITIDGASRADVSTVTRQLAELLADAGPGE